MTGRLGQVPAVIENLVENLRRLELAAKFARDRLQRRLKDVREPAMGGKCLGIELVGPVARVFVGVNHAELVEIVEEAPCLVLLHVETRESQEAPRVVSCVDDLRADPHRGAIGRLFHVDLIHIETEVIEIADALRHLVRHVGLDDGGVGEGGPQLVVALTQAFGDCERVNALVEISARLQVKQFTRDVGDGNVDVVIALAIAETRMKVAGLGVDEIRRKL